MKKVFPIKTIEDIIDHNIEDDTRFLRSGHDFPRSKTAMLIGIRINENYDTYSNLLLNEMAEPIHFAGVRFGIKSAWTIAVILAENLRPADYPRLREAFSKWPGEEKDGLLEWLTPFPEQVKILSNPE